MSFCGGVLPTEHRSVDLGYNIMKETEYLCRYKRVLLQLGNNVMVNSKELVGITE